MGKQKYPEPCVGAMILNKKGEMLLAKSHKWFGRYIMVGGHIELGETMEKALIREVKEEVGLKIKPIILLKIQEGIYSKEFWKPKHYIMMDFLCELVSGKVKIDEDEVQSYFWIKPEKALKMNVDSFTKDTVKEYLKTKRR